MLWNGVRLDVEVRHVCALQAAALARVQVIGPNTVVEALDRSAGLNRMFCSSKSNGGERHGRNTSVVCRMLRRSGGGWSSCCRLDRNSTLAGRQHRFRQWLFLKNHRLDQM